MQESHRMEVVLVEMREREWQLSESDAANMVFRSTRCFRDLFSAAFGMSYRTFRLQKKLEFSRELLRDPSVSITEIALRLGYTSRRKFEQAFKQRFDQTPAQFRAATAELPLRA